jgi:hypothetical protein
MSTNFINNISDQNHGSLISKELKRCDKFILVSPFLVPDFAAHLSGMEINELQEIHLITTLVPRSPDQVKKIESLLTLLNWCEGHGVKCRISLDNQLHAKVYIFQKDDVYYSAIVSSANFTNNGMRLLHEWGVIITDQASITTLVKDILGCLEYESITAADIRKMATVMEKYLKGAGKPSQSKIPVNLLGHLSGTGTLKISLKTNFWLKPIGHSGEYVSPSRSFHHRKDDLHFAKRHPKNISAGDIFIAFAVGSGRIISIYKMLSAPQYSNDQARWPWYITGKNMTTDYGANWWNNNLDIYQLKADFEQQHHGEKIKPGENQSYGGFQWGLDRLKITPAFGKFIIAQINQ